MIVVFGDQLFFRKDAVFVEVNANVGEIHIDFPTYDTICNFLGFGRQHDGFLAGSVLRYQLLQALLVLQAHHILLLILARISRQLWQLLIHLIV